MPPGLHAAVSSTVHVTCVDSVVCVVRRHPAEEMVQVYNVADHPVRVPAWEIDHHVPGATHDLVSGQDLEPRGDQYHLAPYEVSLGRPAPTRDPSTPDCVVVVACGHGLRSLLSFQGPSSQQRRNRGKDRAMTSPKDRTRVRRLPEKAVTDRDALDAVLDAALVAHVGWLTTDSPTWCRWHVPETGIDCLHGSTGSG